MYEYTHKCICCGESFTAHSARTIYCPDCLKKYGYRKLQFMQNHTETVNPLYLDKRIRICKDFGVIIFDDEREELLQKTTTEADYYINKRLSGMPYGLSERHIRVYGSSERKSWHDSRKKK